MSGLVSEDGRYKGQFAADLRADELLPEIRRVCAGVPDVEDFTEITTTAFDEAAEKAGAPLPLAKSLCQRLSISWPSLLFAAHASSAEGVRLLGIGAADHGRKGFRLEDAQYALRRAAASLEQDSVTETQYAAEREEMLRRAGRSATSYSGGQLLLPTLNQLTEIMHQHREKTGIKIFGWDELLESAGLSRRPKRTTGISPELAVETFADDLGVLPSAFKVLDKWAHERGLSLRQDCRSGPTLHAARQAFNAERVAQGLDPLPNASTGEVDWAAVPPAGGKGNRIAKRPRNSWVKSNCLAGLALAMHRIPPGDILKQRTLGSVAPQDPDIPSYATVARALEKHNAERPKSEHEDFDRWRREAAVLARKHTEAELRGLALPVIVVKVGEIADVDPSLVDAMNESFSRLREDPDAAAEFDAETRAWDTTSADGSTPHE